MIYTREQIENWVAQNDALAIWHMLTDQGFEAEATYVERRYFEL
jgi:hypothetical protein